MTLNTKTRGLPYYGGKSPIGSVSKWINSILYWKKGDTYCEPFAGMLGVLLSRPKSNLEIASDADGDIINWWRCVRDRTYEMTHAVKFTPWSREEYETSTQILQSDEEDSLKRAVATHVVLEQNMVHGLGKGQGGWSHKYKGSISRGELSRFDHLAERVRNVQLETRDALYIMKRMADVEESAVYVDPPYITANTSPYNVTPFDKSEMIDIMCSMKGRVALSGYDGDWNEMDTRGWNRHEMQTVHNPIGVNATSKEQHEKRGRVEVLWTNFENQRKTLF